MSLSTKDVANLKKLVALAQTLLREAGSDIATRNLRRENVTTRHRRSGKDLIAFRKLLKSERNDGVPVAAIAKKHGISAAYIYGLK